MENLTKRFGRYAASFSFGRLPKEVVHEAKRRLIDALGCAMGALETPPAVIAHRMAEGVRGPRMASLWGSTRKSTAELAAFVNGTLVRCLDYNDTYLASEPAHPSDNIPTALAVSESEGADGRSLLAAIVLGYEIQCRLCDAGSLRVRGWDHVSYGAFSTPLVAGRLMGLGSDVLAHALSLSVVANNALRQTRVGEISLWKASAFANVARNGIFAAQMAREGMTGPAEILEGEKGFFNVVSGPLSLPRFGGEEGTPFKIMDTYLKFYPVEYHAQSAVDAALVLRPKLGSKGISSIESLMIRTSAVSNEIIGRDPEKWHPKTRETADHSLPYCVAAALKDGTVGLEQFDEAHLHDREIRSLMERTRVEVDAGLSEDYPNRIGNEIEVQTASGKYRQRVDHPKGHPHHPMSDADVEAKFIRLSEKRISSKRMRTLLDQLWDLESMKRPAKLLTHLSVRTR